MVIHPEETEMKQMKRFLFILTLFTPVILTACFGNDPLTKAAGEIHSMSATFYYSFNIRTVPAVATVTIDGEVKGTTPIQFGMTAPADYLQSKHKLQISSDGYKTINIPFNEIEFDENPPPEHSGKKSMKHYNADLLYTLDKVGIAE